jgi:hypothetical protein
MGRLARPVRALSARRSYERQGSLDNDAIYFGDASRIGLEHDDGHPPETLSALTVTGLPLPAPARAQRRRAVGQFGRGLLLVGASQPRLYGRRPIPENCSIRPSTTRISQSLTVVDSTPSLSLTRVRSRPAPTLAESPERLGHKVSNRLAEDSSNKKMPTATSHGVPGECVVQR